MKLVWLEGKRIAGKSWVLLCFFAFLVLGLLVSRLALEQSFEEKGCSVEQYLEAAEGCRGMMLPEAASCLEERAETALHALETWQNYRMGLLSRKEAAEMLMSFGYGETALEDLTFGNYWKNGQNTAAYWMRSVCFCNMGIVWKKYDRVAEGCPAFRFSAVTIM